MLASESTVQLLDRFAAGGTELMTRAATLLRLGEACGTSDPRLVELRHRGDANIRADMREVAAELDHGGVVAPHWTPTTQPTSCSPSSPTRAPT